MIKKITLLALCSLPAFALHYAELKINDKDLEVAGKLDVGQFNENVEPSTIFVGGRFLYVDASHSSNSHANLDPFYELNFLLKKPIGKTGLDLGMGVKMNYTDNFFSVPLGIEGEYKLPLFKAVPMYLNASLYYAPSALSFNDADDYLEYRVGFEVELVQNARVTLSYTNIDTNYEEAPSFTYNESWYIGFKFGF
jgi:hypothetical protein